MQEDTQPRQYSAQEGPIAHQEFDVDDYDEILSESDTVSSNDSSTDSSDECGESQRMSCEETKKCRRGRPKDVNSLPEKHLKRQRITFPAVTILIASAVCCATNCLQILDGDTATSMREQFSALNGNQRSQYIMDHLISHNSLSDGHYIFSYMVGAHAVCLSAWLAVLGCAQSSFYAIRRLFLDGHWRLVALPRKRLNRNSPTTQSAACWLQRYADKTSDRMPNTSKLHLPMCITKATIYTQYKCEMEEEGESVISKGHFFKMWRCTMSHIGIPKVNRFSKCDKCVLYKSLLKKTGVVAQRQSILKKRDKHLKKQSCERAKYYKHKSKGINEADKYLSIIIDGMDQNKCIVPRFGQNPKALTYDSQLKCHLSGCIVHGQGIYGFFDYHQWPHNANLTITVLINTLLMMTSIPDVLYLQLDNCARENKNRFLLAFICWMVEIGIFKKVKISFLMVGHTHEDIDQVFSRFSTRLQGKDVPTLPCLMNHFEMCTTPNPTSVQLAHVWDISELIANFLSPMSRHSKPHAFKITKEGNKAVIRWKKWNSDLTWNDCAGDAVLLKEVPSTAPCLVPQNDEAISTDGIAKGLDNIKRLLDAGDVEWWQHFLTDHKEKGSEASESFQQVLDGLKAKKITEPVPPAADEMDFSDEEDEIAAVTIGRPTKQTPAFPTVGQFCLVDLAKYVGVWPLVGKIIRIHDDNKYVTLHWFHGNKGSQWKKATRPAPEGRGHREDRVETVPVNVIYFHSFDLTGSGYLPKCAKDEADKYMEDI